MNNIESRATQFENGETTFQKYVVNTIDSIGRKIQKETQRPSTSRKRGRCYIFTDKGNKFTIKCKFIPIVKITNKKIVFLYSFHCLTYPLDIIHNFNRKTIFKVHISMGPKIPSILAEGRSSEG